MKLSLLFTTVLVACAVGYDDKNDPPKLPSPPATLSLTGSNHLDYNSCSEVQTHRDAKHGVTCYVILGCDGRAAISCLKQEE
jgi:hypothetical protein